MYEIAEKLFYDLKEPLNYIPVGISVFICVLILLYIRNQICRENRIPVQRIAAIALFFGYLAVAAVQTFFSREPGSRTGVDLQLFSTWGRTAQAHAYVVENVILFLPFGCLLPLAFPYFRRMFRCMGSGFLVSLLIETAQLVTSRGHCQVDDVVMNTFGAGIGYIFFRIMKKML